MEKDDVIEMYLRSIEKNGSKYGVYVSDGDTNSFGAVVDALKNKYGDEYQVRKEDCIGHIQKRMGNSPRKYKNNSKGTLLSDNKSDGGSGRLTDKIVDKIQTYYGYAIGNNIKNTDMIIKAVWAIYHHMIIGPPE